MSSRRRLLRRLAVGGGLAVAGCLGTDETATNSPTTAESSESPTRTRTEPSDTSPTPTPSLAERGVPDTICDQSPQDPGGENIAAVIEPAFADDWSEVAIRDQYTPGRDGGLAPDSVVVGLTDGDRARAYPLAVLWWHEIVNDTFGVPTLVTYCPLCRSGLVAERVVNGEPTQFTVTELLWTPPSAATNDSVERGTAFGANFNETETGVRDDRGNLVMLDAATESFWSQLLATAICGPQTGETLPVVPSTTARWADWQSDHPDTDVLLPPPHSEVSII